MPSKLIKAEEAALMLDVSKEALKVWRQKGIGPQPVFLSARTMRYRLDEVEAFIKDGYLNYKDSSENSDTG